ncbi:hypothetical protein IV203_036154 [Nitzschia inconspicua]|uniref:Uncharacterized protein n=1 Tax=Nitzschia inconspicua TaxID=303405 RepID=A0A9K3LEQ0_9STRA|nr:hypothetical protein IV203_036154 [Nitzschia inconspicua]
MKLSFATFAFSLLVGGNAMKASVTDKDLKAVGDKRRLEQDFMRAMHDNPKIRDAKRKQREQQRKRQLLDKLMEHATPRHLADSSSNGEYTFEDSYEWMNPVYQQMVEDGVFDLTARAFKYSGCAAIKSFDAERAQENGNPMVVDTYAVFRLCPEDTCNKYSLTGCGKNYGEYVVSMSTYLQFMLDFYEDHYGAYCEYCFPCDYDYQVAKRNTQTQCYEKLDQNEYKQKQSQQQQAWQNYYEQNYGDMSQFYQKQQDQANQMYEQQQQYMAQQYGEQYAQQQQQQQQYYQNQYAQNQNNQNQGYNMNNANNVQYNSYNNNGGNRKLDDASGSSSSQYQGANAYGNGWSNYFSSSQSGNANAYQANANANDYNQANQANQYNGGYFGAWINGQYAANQQNPSDYYSQWWKYQNNANGNNNQYGYYDEYGNYIDLCQGNGWSDSSGREYDLDCEQYQSKKAYTCKDGTACDACEYEIDQKYMPCDQYVCGDYYTYCSDLYEPEYNQMYQWRANNNNQNNNNNNNNNNQNNNQNNQQNELYKFLECTEYVNDYGQRYYVGPHCASDHYTISLGIFSDENCVNYIGETVSLSKVLGYGMDDEQFFHLPHECISCDGARQYADDQQRWEQMQKGQGVYGEYVEPPNTQFDDIVAMCAALFERSAQCNIHMQNYAMMSKYVDELDAAFEQRYCNFIDNIVYGAYDEEGEIKLRPESFDLADWRNPEQYKKIRMPAGQAIMLSISVLLVVALSALAFFTHRSLTRQSTPWRPKRASVDLDRQTSGIIMGRAQSGIAHSTKEAPLI